MNLLISDPDLKKSAQALDDARLIKQILECYQICKINEAFLSGNTQIGYRNHPVVVYYRDKLELVVDFGAACCTEYLRRFKRVHAYFDLLCKKRIYLKLKNINQTSKDPKSILSHMSTDSTTVPIYVDGQNSVIGDSVYNLFKQKLNDKWLYGKAIPRWKNYNPPDWALKEAKDRFDEHKTLAKLKTKSYNKKKLIER